MTYIYFLLLSNNHVYKGMTRDLRRRLREHQSGAVDSTRPYRPVQLIAYEAYAVRSDAVRREKYLKTTEGRRLLKKQLRDTLEALDV